MRFFVEGRKFVFPILEKNISKKDEVIWLHCASLGEFEQGVPIMKELKERYQNYKLVVSFFSPSGYEVKKNTELADVVIYLPLDTIRNAKKFIKKMAPSLVIFVKYEFWPNYLFELKKMKIPTILVSGLFRENQSFFKWYGGFMRRSLRSFNHFFVQNEASKSLLESIGFSNVTTSGDTRFDRVSQQLTQNNYLIEIENFKQKQLCLVCGSTWQDDENILLEFINTSSNELKIIIAPHNIKPLEIERFRKKIIKKSVLFSELKKDEIVNYSILIIDNVGLLSKIYSYADIAYVGGAMGTTGLHNILEPATFGVPVVIGKNYANFPEAKQLLDLGGLFSVNNAEECNQILKRLVKDQTYRNLTGKIAQNFVETQTGATLMVMEYINSLNL
ncbi:MAG: 3-deoxy-D-manno-octulosonic acid transferase [Flavobacteriales bacterium]